jgi:hypothetical protein
MPRTYLGGRRYVVTIDASDPMDVEDGSFTVGIGVDEVTNLNSGGFYEDVPTIKRATASLRCVFNGDDPPEFEEGDIIALVISAPGAAEITGPPLIPAIPPAPILSGNFRVVTMTYPVVTPKAAVRYTLEVSSNGAYVRGLSPDVPPA